jgi:DNA-directed RNA polymerase specialized sigma24 family protein
MSREDDSDVVTVQRRERFENGAAELLNKLFRIVYHWTLDVDLANEIVQEALFRFLFRMDAEKWSRDIQNMDAYLIEIARNYRNDLWRKRKKEPLISLDSQFDEHKEVNQASLLNNLVADIGDRIDLEKLREEVPLKIIFRGLSEYDEYLLNLHKVEDLSPKKIAEITGDNVDSLRYRLTKLQATIRYRAKQYVKASGKKSLF